MPPNILDLPDEVLNICLRELLPPIAKLTINWVPMAEPRYLKGLLTLCKTFNKLALPWVWRRIELPYNELWRRVELFSSGRWTFLRDHPEVAYHIRFLALNVTPYATSKYVAPLCAIVPLMKNLRVLRLSVDGKANLDLICKLYIALLSRPHLHTLALKSYIPTKFIHGLPSLTNLRRLNIQGCKGIEPFLLQRTQFLESFAISSTAEQDIPIPWTTMSIPWATLRELSVYDNHGYHSEPLDNWYLIVENYSSWKKSFPDTPSRLTELFITLVWPNIELEHIKLLATFGPQLCRLCLAYLGEIDQEILDQIVEGFPYLHELHILSLTENGPEIIAWRVEPTAIAESLGKLSMLKRLNLNYVDVVPYQERDSDEWPRNAVRNVVPVIGRACKSLEILEFYHDFPGDESCFGWTSFTILRNDNGWYESYLQTEGDDGFRPLTSGWDLGNYSCI